MPFAGLCVVDKPAGPSSHDVVARARRAFRTPRVGHAGTLDPAASGVLVVMVGEATKLGPFLVLDRKRYEARVAFGVATDTLDAEGVVTARGPAEAPSAAALADALRAEGARVEQLPPQFSAIKVGGQKSYDRARRGLVTELAPRPVDVGLARALGTGRAPSRHAEGELPFVDVELEVSKGYYVRAFARDLGERLGVPTHLTALRRTESGPFAIANALPLSDLRPELDGPFAGPACVPLAEAARLALPSALLTEAGAACAAHGKKLDRSAFVDEPPQGLAAWFGAMGTLIAVGSFDGTIGQVQRGFGRDAGEA